MRLFFGSLILLFCSGLVSANDQVSLQLLWKHQFQFAGYYMAIEKGFYAEEGLEVELKEFDYGTNLVDEVLEGRSQFAVGRTSLLIDKNAGADVVSLFAAYQQSPLMLLTRRDSGIVLSSDLKGKNVMITNDAKNVGEVIAMLLQTGITISDINQQQHSYNVQDLIDGNTDAMASYISNEPYQMEQAGVEYSILHPKDYGFDMYSDILFTSRKYIKNNPLITDRFYRASLRGWLYAFENIDETARIIFERYNSQNKTLEALHFEGRELKKLAFDEAGNFGTLSLNKFNEMAQVYLITGSIYRGYDFSDFIYQPPSNVHRFSKAEQGYLSSNPLLRVCINPAWHPYESYSEGEHKGMISDYLRLIMKNVGLRYRLIPTSTWRETLLFAKSGKCDLVAGAMQTVQRSSYLEFTKPYLSIPAVVATLPEKSGIRLNDKRIGVLARSAFHDILSNRYPGATFILVDSYVDGLRMLKSGSVDAVAGADASISYLLKEQQISDVTISDTLHDNWDISVAVTKNQPYLLGIMNKSIAAITPVEHDRINNRWMTVEYKHTVDYRVIWWLLMVVSVVAVFALYRYLKISAYNKMLKRIAEKDALTGILSRHKLRSELEGFIDLADRHDWRLSLIFFDVDDFKLVNDQFGHTAGDRVLVELTQLVSDGSRKTDRFGRWGGEEFLFLMLETDLNSAHQIADKIRLKISEHLFSVPMKITCSFGVAEYEKGESIEQLVNRADRALYVSKETGKNKVENSLP